MAISFLTQTGWKLMRSCPFRISPQNPTYWRSTSISKLDVLVNLTSGLVYVSFTWVECHELKLWNILNALLNEPFQPAYAYVNTLVVRSPLLITLLNVLHASFISHSDCYPSFLKFDLLAFFLKKVYEESHLKFISKAFFLVLLISIFCDDTFCFLILSVMFHFKSNVC